MLSFERLKELKVEFEQMRKHNDRHYMSTITEDDVLEVLDEAIARQSETETVVCPDCGGSGVYQEYDEYDRYHVHACGKCDGTGEIARQSVKSEDVQRAIEYYVFNLADRLHDGKDEVTKRFETVITALQAFQPTTRKNRTVEEVRALQEYQQWIPVSNVKPEKSGRYIAYVPEHWTADSHKEGEVIIAYFRELNYEGRRRSWDDGAYGISGEVTHYLPLPEPPKGE